MANLSTSGTRKNLSKVHSKDTLHCLLLSLQGTQILLPNTAVAEVIGDAMPDSVDDAPDWLIGNISWRDERVPLLSFERLSGAGKSEHTTGRIAVLNTLNGDSDLPYIALLIQGIPQLRLIQESIIVEANTHVDEYDVVAARMDLGDETVLIPDLDKLEKHVLELGRSVLE